jgi:hypothetical protein
VPDLERDKHREIFFLFSPGYMFMELRNFFCVFQMLLLYRHRNFISFASPELLDSRNESSRRQLSATTGIFIQIKCTYSDVQNSSKNIMTVTWMGKT